MSYTIYDASAPVLVKALGNMQAWLDKAVEQGKDEAALMGARLAPDMMPFAAQFQVAAGNAQDAVARLAGMESPPQPTPGASFADLKAILQRAIDFIQSVPPSALAGAETRQIALRFPNGMGFKFDGAGYLNDFVLPNFFFHVTTAYALLRAAGMNIGKGDFLAHLGQPLNMDAA